MTAGQLAAELEVSVRTIYRDVGSLQAAGIPLYGDAGPAGGYQLVAGYRTRLTGMTAAEAEALALAGIPGPAAELGLGGVLAAAQLKLDAALPAEMRSRAALVRERFHLDAPGWYHDGDAVPHLSKIADTVWKQQRIDVRYRRWRAPTDVTRRLDPHGLVLKAGKWYLVARDDDGMRTYRINQILDLAVLAEPFERAADFDLAEYWTAGISEFRAGLHQGKATIRALSRRAGSGRCALQRRNRSRAPSHSQSAGPRRLGHGRRADRVNRERPVRVPPARRGRRDHRATRTAGPHIGRRARSGRDLPSRPAERSKLLKKALGGRRRALPGPVSGPATLPL